MKRIPKVQISGKCTARSKMIVGESKYTFGDAVDFFAMAINNPRKRLELEIKVVENEIEELKLDLVLKEVALEKLNEHLNSIDPEPELIDDNPKIKKAVSSIKSIAKRFGCDPVKVNQFTNKDTLGFHADNCGVSRVELIELISSDVSGDE
ncbi:MAG: hypothetical protein Q8M06_08635 [Methanobacteriaceae archaeon]|jgi:hypothetical protein|nr:hypothetical protein [Methanobacteriaceae archaeon]MDZ4171112.1 hypothetical protein [Methanobacteriaceae archaeon]